MVGTLELDADGVGDQGNRGVKILHNSKHESPMRTEPQGASTHYWARTVSALIDAKAGDSVLLQGIQNISSGDDLPVRSASIAAAWMRPRP